VALLLKSKCLNGDFGFGFTTDGKPFGFTGLGARTGLLLVKLVLGRAEAAGLGTEALNEGCDCTRPCVACVFKFRCDCHHDDADVLWSDLSDSEIRKNL
jgi:hypothetical protein